jgi:hypothetical protein
MKKNNLIWIIVLVIFVGFVAWLIKTPGRQVTSKYDAFATCLKDSGTIFYGAFWCPHCQKQKAMFGSAAKLLPYVECSTPDGKSQIQACTDAKVEGYPTWVFPNGVRQSGEVSLEELAKQSSCVLPQ